MRSSQLIDMTSKNMDYNRTVFSIGSLTLDQLRLPCNGDEEVYLVRQFRTTSKGFINRG